MQRLVPSAIPKHEFVLVYLPTNTVLFRGGVLECAATLEQHTPNATVSELVERGYRVRRADASSCR